MTEPLNRSEAPGLLSTPAGRSLSRLVSLRTVLRAVRDHGAISRAQLAREVLCAPLPYVGNSEGVQKSGEGSRFAFLDPPQEVVDRLLPETVELDQLVSPLAQPVDARDVDDEAKLEKPVEQLVAQSFDVHRPSTDEVVEALDHLCGAGAVGAL